MTGHSPPPKNIPGDCKALPLRFLWVLLKETSSTNAVSHKLAAQGFPEGAMVIADGQTQGRGRHGRTWVSPPEKGIYLSLLLKPPVSDLSPLTLLAGVAAVKALSPFTAMPLTLKWPNDLLLGSKKIGGILCERLPGNDPPAVVIGMGLNINQTPSDFPPPLDQTAVSLRMIEGRSFRRWAIISRLSKELALIYQDFLNNGPERTIAQWMEHSAMMGRRVTLQQGQKTWKGTALRLDSTGRLVLQTGQGETAFDAGEVTLSTGDNESI